MKNSSSTLLPISHRSMEPFLVGGFNPSEKYESNWESSPIFGLKINNNFKPPPSFDNDPWFCIGSLGFKIEGSF